MALLGTVQLFCLLVTALLGQGCAAPSDGFRTSPLPQEVTFWQPWLLNYLTVPLSEVPCGNGCREGSGAAAGMAGWSIRFLKEHCEKPDGVRVVRSDTHPTRRKPPRPRLTSLALRIWMARRRDRLSFMCCITIARMNPSLKTANPHAVVFPYPSAIFVDRNYNEAGFGDVLGGLILKHEAAHLVGAARNPSHGDGAHCRNAGLSYEPCFHYVPELSRDGWRRRRRRLFVRIA